METMLYLTFLVRYIAFVAGVALVGALVLGTAYVLVRDKVRQISVVRSPAWHELIKGSV
jgi:hypothetical protein